MDTDFRSALIRSISCIVCAVKYDSPQCGQDHIGMPSMTSKSFPLPKVRVTLRSCGPARPQDRQVALDEVDRDEEERTPGADFDDGLSFKTAERAPADDVLDFAGFGVSLSLDNLAREDNVFEVEDREVVIFKFFSSVKGHDIVQGTNEVANPCNSLFWHTPILRDRLTGCQTTRLSGPQGQAQRRRCGSAAAGGSSKPLRGSVASLPLSLKPEIHRIGGHEAVLHVGLHHLSNGRLDGQGD